MQVTHRAFLFLLHEINMDNSPTISWRKFLWTLGLPDTLHCKKVYITCQIFIKRKNDNHSIK